MGSHNGPLVTLNDRSLYEEAEHDLGVFHSANQQVVILLDWHGSRVFGDLFLVL